MHIFRGLWAKSTPLPNAMQFFLHILSYILLAAFRLLATGSIVKTMVYWEYQRSGRERYQSESWSAGVNEFLTSRLILSAYIQLHTWFGGCQRNLMTVWGDDVKQWVLWRVWMTTQVFQRRQAFESIYASLFDSAAYCSAYRPWHCRRLLCHAYGFTRHSTQQYTHGGPMMVQLYRNTPKL